MYQGLAETLRQELLLYSIDVHIYMPVTMFSPGYDEENKTKPALTLKLEESDGGLSPEKAAEGLYEGTVPPLFLTIGLIANIYRREEGRIPHHRYAHRRFVPNGHPRRLAIRIKRP